MKSNQGRFVTRASVIAVRGALAALAAIPAAYAQGVSEEVRELTQPRSVVEIGAGHVSDSSAKFGEFNGLDDKGGYLIGNVDLQGRGSADDTFRWRITGTNLGLETRGIGAEVGQQGRFRITLGYDELKRNYSDTFRTIYDGAGTTRLTLPGGYPAPTTRLGATGTRNDALANWANLQSPFATAACAAANDSSGACAGPGVLIPALMHDFEIETKRKRGNVGFSYRFSPEWEFTASARRENKDGTKVTGFGVNGPGRGFTLPEPIDSTTDIFKAGVGYVGKAAYLNVGYTGSIYKNAINLWTAQNPFQNLSMLNNIAQLAGAPDNEMHQVNMSGGYSFSPRTKLVVAGSYARLTQNESFDVSYPASVLIPVNSVNAEVISTSFMARLTSRAMKGLTLNAVYKYDNRDNETPSHLYAMIGADNGTSATVNRVFANEPFNRRQQKFSADADYSLGRDRAVNGGYEWQQVAYSAHNDLLAIPSHGNHESTFRVEYRDNLAETLTGRMSLSRSLRRMDGEYREGDPLPLTPVISEDLASLIATGRITVGAGGVITQVAPFSFPAADPLLPGFRQFFLADRNRDKLRGTLNYQASEALSLDGRVDYNRDEFNNSPYGVKSSRSWMLSLDASFKVSDTFDVHGNFTREDMQTKMDSLAILRGTVRNPLVTGSTGTTLLPANNATVCVGSVITNTATATTPADYWLDPCRKWGMEQADKINTLSVGFRAGGLMAGRLELTGDLVYARSRTPITLDGGTYTTNGTSGAGSTQVYYSAESLPDITSTMTEVRVSGRYALSKASAVRLSYLGRKLTSSDWQFDAYANDAVAFQTFLGTMETSPRYTVHVFAISYSYSFR